MDTIGIKIKTKEQVAVIIKVLRKYTELSMGEIKDKISTGKYVYECRFVDGEGITVIKSIYRELSDADVETEIYEHGRLTNIEFLENLLNRYSEIDEEIDRMLDEEVGK